MHKAEGSGELELYFGYRVRKYLDGKEGTDTESLVVVPRGSEITVNNELHIDFPGAVYIAGRSRVKFSTVKGQIIYAAIKELPAWYQRYNEAAFPEIWQEILQVNGLKGFNRSGANIISPM